LQDKTKPVTFRFIQTMQVLFLATSLFHLTVK